MTQPTQVATIPRFDSFHFGMFTCASCLSRVGSAERVSYELREPVFSDYAETEVLIPAGRQSFHPVCWREGALARKAVVA